MPFSPSERSLRREVRSLLYSNKREGYSPLLQDNYCYISPSGEGGPYPFQWFWDSCFHIHMMCALGEHEFAKRNLASIFAMQDSSGFVGHMVFWKQVLPQRHADIFQAKPTFKSLRPHMSALIQPPTSAQALLRIVKTFDDIPFAERMWRQITKYHQWLMKNRCDQDNLLFIIAPVESGMDSKPTYDEVLNFEGKSNQQLGKEMMWVDRRNFFHRYHIDSIHKADYFIVKDVLVNVSYVEDLLAMAELAEIVSDDPSMFRSQAALTEKALLNEMYNEEDGRFVDLLGAAKQKSHIKTADMFTPIGLPNIDLKVKQRLITEHLTNQDEFWTEFPIPSVAINEVSFEPNEVGFLWRGPTWLVFNWWIYNCLNKAGYTDEAETIRQSVFRLIETSGFREYYNPFTGEGYGARDFTWSGLAIDMLDS